MLTFYLWQRHHCFSIITDQLQNGQHQQQEGASAGKTTDKYLSVQCQNIALHVLYHFNIHLNPYWSLRMGVSNLQIFLKVNLSSNWGHVPFVVQ